MAAIYVFHLMAHKLITKILWQKNKNKDKILWHTRISDKKKK